MDTVKLFQTLISSFTKRLPVNALCCRVRAFLKIYHLNIFVSFSLSKNLFLEHKSVIISNAYFFSLWTQ